MTCATDAVSVLPYGTYTNSFGPDLALALSDRTVALERGEVAHVGPSAALSRDLDLRRQVLWM